jgi:anti-sigma B factor antagonist
VVPAPEGDFPGFYVGHEALGQDRHVIKLGGELDLHAAPELRNALDELIEQGAAGIVLDMSDTTFIDSSTLGTMVGAQKRMGAAGRVHVVCTNEHVLRMFKYAGLDQVLPVHSSREDALDALA